MTSQRVWLIGAGAMAIDYAKVLLTLNVDFLVIGNGAESAIAFEKKTGQSVHIGGLSEFLKTQQFSKPTHVIVAVDAIYLYDIALLLCEQKIQNILLEKPGPLLKNDVDKLVSLVVENGSKMFIGYNRRFYASVLALKSLLSEKVVTSFDFEFTEWIHKIKLEQKSELEKNKLLLVYSTHIIDLAFYLGGFPSEMSCFANNGFDWHKSGGVFSGAGVTQKGALFSYKANWKSAGRWSLCIQTDTERFILCPLERLQIQNKGTIIQNDVPEIDYCLDEDFKAGLYLQTTAFLNKEQEGLCTISEQQTMMKVYQDIAKY